MKYLGEEHRIRRAKIKFQEPIIKSQAKRGSKKGRLR